MNTYRCGTVLLSVDAASTWQPNSNAKGTVCNAKKQNKANTALHTVHQGARSRAYTNLAAAIALFHGRRSCLRESRALYSYLLAVVRVGMTTFFGEKD